ncbi:putative Late embryogenesis abundant protein [Helianthus annuus]|uniref:Late embryogenesis abundant protein n=1 Tax=Helianthus annuus TaxID=4232 RepID=A0A251TWM4_HELAN|nr:late embryogenesis abundant protein At5g17165 isoform X2 [Helianthus annuus]KAF5790929.1 putative Late embryogenesis abundant protein [Helianthus annuus]
MAASFGNRFLSQIRTSPAVHPNLVVLRRAVHVSVYDKNIEDQIRPSLVPEEAVTRAEPEKYWVPDPKTGVFGPAGEKSIGGALGSEPKAVDGSVLEQKAFFRPLENLEKPTHP